jgi:hypothetical protein
LNSSLSCPATAPSFLRRIACISSISSQAPAEITIFS